MISGVFEDIVQCALPGKGGFRSSLFLFLSLG